MKCEHCNCTLTTEDTKEHLGRKLCEDCYMEALSPMRTCDPWAVHSAKNFERYSGTQDHLTSLQSKILNILKDTGAIEPLELLRRLGGNLTIKELEREFSTLRHLEKVRGEKQNNRILWRLW